MAAVPAWFDFKAAIIASLLMASIIGGLNAGHGTEAALLAGGKQALYTFFFAGLIMQFCRRTVAAQPDYRSAMIKGILYPQAITVGLISLVHGLRGTAEPLYSIAAVAILALLGFFGVSRRHWAELHGPDAV